MENIAYRDPVRERQDTNIMLSDSKILDTQISISKISKKAVNISRTHCNPFISFCKIKVMILYKVDVKTSTS